MQCSTLYLSQVIRSFKDERTEALFRADSVPALRAIESVARRKLDMIDAAIRLFDMRSPPGNRLEALKGNRRGQHSIRINDRWRICFIWRNGGAELVEIVDYH